MLGEPSGHVRSLRAANLLEHGFQYRLWQDALKVATINSLVPAADAKETAISVRDTVSGYTCGGRKARPSAVAKAKQKRLAAAQQKAAAVIPAAKAAPAVAQPGVVAPVTPVAPAAPK